MNGTSTPTGTCCGKREEWIHRDADGGAEPDIEFHKLDRAVRDTDRTTCKVHGDDGSGTHRHGSVHSADEQFHGGVDWQWDGDDHLDADGDAGN